MKKYCFLLILVIFSVSAGLAQVKLGVQGSLLRSQVTMEDTSSFVMAIHGDNKARFGFRAGVFAELPLSGSLFLASSLNFVRKGAEFKSRFFSEQISTKYITHHLELPVNLMIKNSGSGGFYGGAGPTLSIGLGGKRKYYSISDANEEKSSELKIKFDNKTWAEAGMKDYHLKFLELGLQAYAGYELPNRIRLQLEYHQDLSNLSVSPETSSYKNRYLALTVGCLL
ncbi:hypothetical protein GCM10027051_25220 [Niabella terrae]